MDIVALNLFAFLNACLGTGALLVGVAGIASSDRAFFHAIAAFVGFLTLISGMGVFNRWSWARMGTLVSGLFWILAIGALGLLRMLDGEQDFLRVTPFMAYWAVSLLVVLNPVNRHEFTKKTIP